LVRRELHRLGYRYRVNFAPVPGVRRTADIVFTRQRIAVLIDGCFWHRCPIHYVEPKTRTEFWAAKIAGNVARDDETRARFEAAGWTVLRFWEHEDPGDVVSALVEAVGFPGQPSRTPLT
jgi:DNA mismatch endonuclease (patch repair protein)